MIDGDHADPADRGRVTEAPSMLGRASAGQVEEREDRFVEIRRPARRLEPVVVYAPVNPVVF